MSAHLTPMHKRMLRLLFDKNATAETSKEIAAELRITEDAVNHYWAKIYDHFGVRSMRGLFRILDEIAAELD